TFYFRPFQEALEIITKANFDSIELDLYWKGGEWEIGQHLKHISIKNALKLIEDYNLDILSIHPAGGFVPDVDSTPEEIMNPNLYEILNQLPEIPPCIVFHAPHGVESLDLNWWNYFSMEYAHLLNDFQKKSPIITIENMPDFGGLYNPLMDPEDLKAYTEKNGLEITFDTTHCAEIGVDVVDSLISLNKNTKTLHISDFFNGGRHLFIGHGEIKWDDFFKNVNYSNLHTITLECAMSSKFKSEFDMTKEELIVRLRKAKNILENLIAKSSER
ncbi:MAG: sugar phosphate isomerase/epimerase family protein, partial [Promethearchaeota archaeon]